jgi:protein AATF/BFR2
MASPPRRTLAQQLKQLEAEDAGSPAVDVDSAYSSIEPHAFRQVEKEHYLDVGPSKLRREVDTAGLGERYQGKTVGRVKIFEDDDDEEDMEEGLDGDEEDEEDGESNEEDDGDEDEDEEDEDEDEEGEEDEEADGDDDAGEAEDEPAQQPSTVKSSRSLDPLSSLREARLKDIEKGKAIRRQKVR